MGRVLHFYVGKFKKQTNTDWVLDKYIVTAMFLHYYAYKTFTLTFISFKYGMVTMIGRPNQISAKIPQIL